MGSISERNIFETITKRMTMKIIIENTYEDMSRQVAHDLIETMQLFDEPLLLRRVARTEALPNIDTEATAFET